MRSIIIDGVASNYMIDINGVVYNKHGVSMIPRDNGHGYLQIGLRIDKKRKNFKIHRLLALAFIPNPLNLPEINHIDNNPMNNDITNLEWTTHLANMQHKMKQGRHLRINEGISNGFNKYSESTIKKIKKALITQDFTHKEIANIYGVSHSLVSAISTGRKWKHLEINT